MKLPTALRSAPRTAPTGISRTVRGVWERQREPKDRRVRSYPRYGKGTREVVVQAGDGRTEPSGGQPGGRPTRGDGAPKLVGPKRKSHLILPCSIASNHSTAPMTPVVEITRVKTTLADVAFWSSGRDLAVVRKEARDPNPLYYPLPRTSSRFELLVREPHRKDRDSEAQAEDGCDAEPELELAVRHLRRERTATTPGQTFVSTIHPRSPLPRAGHASSLLASTRSSDVQLLGNRTHLLQLIHTFCVLVVWALHRHGREREERTFSLSAHPSILETGFERFVHFRVLFDGA